MHKSIKKHQNLEPDNVDKFSTHLVNKILMIMRVNSCRSDLYCKIYV